MKPKTPGEAAERAFDEWLNIGGPICDRWTFVAAAAIAHHEATCALQAAEDRSGTVALTKYQRDNLAWLLRLVQAGDVPGANTGDWVGEILYVVLGLQQEQGPGESPNVPLEHFRKMYGKAERDALAARVAVLMALLRRLEVKAEKAAEILAWQEECDECEPVADHDRCEAAHEASCALVGAIDAARAALAGGKP